MDKSQRDKEMAAYMKKMGIERKTQVCPLCYRVINREQNGWKNPTRYTHICRG